MSLTLLEHPFAAYCWKALIALYEREVPFEAEVVEADRSRLAELWPMASIPVLVDDAASVTLPESTTIIEYLDGIGSTPPLIPIDAPAALQARLWDRVIDGHVMTPMQKIVGDNLRPDNARDPYGVAEAHAALERVYPVLDAQLSDRAWLAGERFTVADCAAGPALHYADVVHPWDGQAVPHLARYYAALTSRPSVARVIDEARPFRPVFPMPWPAHVA